MAGGLEHYKDTAMNANAVWEILSSIYHSNYLPETFLLKMNDCWKKMELGDKADGVTKPFSNTMLPSLLHYTTK
eukprot:412683-Ditylum_brightwellii.AAC.1